MMGPKQEAQAALFYEFSLEEHVPQDHLLRSINRFVDLSGIRVHLADFYSNTGRPSVDPELLIRMLLVGYLFWYSVRAAAVRRGASEPRISLVSLGGHVWSTPFFALMGSAALGRVQASFRARRLATSADRMGYEGSDGLALPRNWWKVLQRRNQRCGLIRPSHPPGRAFPPTGGFRCPVSMRQPPVHWVFARLTNGNLSRQTTSDA